MKNIFFLCFAALFLFQEGNFYAQSLPSPGRTNQILIEEEENLNVFQQWIRWNNPGSLLMHYLINEAFVYYKIRDEEIAKLKTKDDWLKRQEWVKGKLSEIVGPFPEKTPLNPRITGILKKDGYRVEKIIYESMPGLYVTGCLFIPDGIKGKVPAVLNVIGHNQEAFRAELYQIIILNLVKKGIVVFAIDPPGQGENVQYYDPKINLSEIGYSVVEHCYFGNQCFLSGSSAARYFTWDGIRALDFLTTLKYVDHERIGLTGFSGGGTVTSYIAAFDDRVKVSVPCSWSTASRRQIETKGAQDAEAEFYHGVAEGITFEDLLEVRAPKPTLMTFVSRDEYLSLQGAREAYSETKKAYDAFGSNDNLELVEDDSKHWMTPKIRLAIYTFFMKHFNISGNPAEEKVEILSEKELTVTPTGQISTFLGGEMIFDVNKKETLKLIENLEKSRKDIENHLKIVQTKAKELSGYIEPLDYDEEPFINGRYKRDGYTVEKYAIRGEGNYAVPILVFVPDDSIKKHTAIVYLNPEGKIADAKTGGEIEKLVKKGFIVAATDVLGVGETKNTAARGLTDGYTAVLIGRSVVGIQAGDIVRVVNYLTGRSDIDPMKIGAIGINEMCLPLLHAAAFDPSINSIVLIGSQVSYRSIVMNRYYKTGLTKREGGGLVHPYEVDFSWGIAGVLTAYDLPDLISCIAPRRIVLGELKDQMLEPASAELIDQELEFPRTVYVSDNASDNMKVVSSFENYGSLIDWCFR
jgi:dienelactone hydrolase